MALGLAGKLNILQQSPHDLLPPPQIAQPDESSHQHWVPSRYNVRATAEDGRLVLWNSLSGKMTVFKPEDRNTVINLLHKQGFRAKKEGLVEYLIRRGYIVQDGVDEYRQFQFLFGQQHYRPDALELILMSSEDCNFRCTYCYEDFARGTMLPEVRTGIKKFTQKRIKKLNRLSVSWFGGEPLYGWQAIEDLAPFFLEITTEHDIPFNCHMTTNGYLLSKEIATKLLAWKIRHFQITLDGLPKDHNTSRAARDGSPTFETIFQNLTSMANRDEDFHIILRVNFNPKNSDGLSHFVDLLARHFKHDPRFSLALHAVGKLGGSNDAQLDICEGGDAERTKQEIQEYARVQGVHFDNLRNVAKAGNKVCYAARPHNLLIGATGKVMKCTVVLDKQEHNVVGKITPEGELELNPDRMALWTEPAYEQDSQCRKCVVLPNCQGISCPLVRIEEQARPCISTRSNPKGELLAILDSPGGEGRAVIAQI